MRIKLILAFALVAALGTAGSAQLASRPVEEWIKVLDAPERLAGLKIAEVVASLKLAPGSTVADLGAGTGPFAVPLANAVGPRGKIYAIEIDRNFLPLIEAKAKAANVSNVVTVIGAPTDPQLPASDVDVAFFHDVLHHIENRPAYLKTITKYLKPTSRIVVIEFNPEQSPHKDQPSLVVSKEQTAAWLAGVGFKPVADVPLFTDKWFVVYGKS